MKITHNATGGNLLDYVQLFLEPQKTLYYLFSTYAVVLWAWSSCSGTNTSNFYSALWKKLEENKRQRELPRKKVVQKVVQVWWRREEGADCQLQHGQEVSFNKQLFKYLFRFPQGAEFYL